MDVDEAAERLYALPPEDFTAERDGLAAQADGDARRGIKALRRPTAAAYVVNRLVRAHPDDMDALLDLGDELRQAMAGGGDLRALTEQRRAAISDLVAAARDEADRELTAAIEQDVSATLEAATADPELAVAVRSGRLVKPLRYAGFGTLPDLADAVATPVAGPRRTRRSTRSGPSTRRATTRSATRAAKGATPDRRAQRKRTTDEPAPTAAELAALRQRVLDLAGAADDAQRRYDAASRAVQQARDALDAAERERADAHRAASAAHKEVERARRELGRLERG